VVGDVLEEEHSHCYHKRRNKSCEGAAGSPLHHVSNDLIELHVKIGSKDLATFVLLSGPCHGSWTILTCLEKARYCSSPALGLKPCMRQALRLWLLTTFSFRNPESLQSSRNLESPLEGPLSGFSLLPISELLVGSFFVPLLYNRVGIVDKSVRLYLLGFSSARFGSRASRSRAVVV
jgi:hypothetical protein